MKRSRGKELKQEMNLTNMIDIVFAILIVFIISAPLMSQGVKVDLPKAEAPTMEQEKLLKVSITKNEEIYIADMMVDFSSFNSVFKSLWNGEMAVVINSDEDLAKFQNSIYLSFKPEDAFLTPEEVVALTAYNNPDATYAGLVDVLSHMTIDDIK